MYYSTRVGGFGCNTGSADAVFPFLELPRIDAVIPREGEAFNNMNV